jgi:hypothetical protein
MPVDCGLQWLPPAGLNIYIYISVYMKKGTYVQAFSFLSEATDVPTKTIDLVMGQKGYFNL